jgi:hypothetical protein
MGSSILSLEELSMMMTSWSWGASWASSLEESSMMMMIGLEDTLRLLLYSNCELWDGAMVSMMWILQWLAKKTSCVEYYVYICYLISLIVYQTDFLIRYEMPWKICLCHSLVLNIQQQETNEYIIMQRPLRSNGKAQKQQPL